jgi:hypothetical protein
MKSRSLVVVSALVVVLLGGAVVLLSAPAKGGTTIQLGSEGIAAEITLKDGSRITLTAKPQSIRPGTYQVKLLVISKQDEKKNVWRLYASESLNTMETIMVEEGQQKIVDCGPPVVFSFYGKQMPNKTVHFGGSGTGKYSEVYYPCAFAGGQPVIPPPGPTFELRDEAGKPIGAGRFTVAAKSGGLVADWTYPKDFKGKYTMVLKPALGPFEWKLVDNNFKIE